MAIKIHGQTLTIKEFAKILGIHPTVLVRWIDQGLLKYYKISPGDRQFTTRNINHFLKERDKNLHEYGF